MSEPRKKYELHGLARTSEYQAWFQMRQRCRQSTHSEFKNYGGRGIQVCQEWQLSFTAFLAHVGQRPTPQHSLDRINNEGNYEPGNVRWAMPSEQADNRRGVYKYTWRGETMTTREWALRMDLPYERLRTRLRRMRWPLEKALTAPVSEQHQINGALGHR